MIAKKLALGLLLFLPIFVTLPYSLKSISFGALTLQTTTYAAQCYNADGSIIVGNTTCPDVPVVKSSGVDLGGVLSAISNLPGLIASQILNLIGNALNINTLFTNIASWATCTIGGGQLTSTGCVTANNPSAAIPGSLAYVSTSKSNYVQTFGLIGVMTSTLDRTFAPPDIKAVDYLASIRLLPQVQAAGIDRISGTRNVVGSVTGFFTGFFGHPIPEKPILAVWFIMRNIAYSLYVLVLIAIGFMVMFRSKIDPRTVVTVTSALPQIVISLILITFSFPIAGLFVDIMQVLLELVKNVFSPLVTIPPDLGLAGFINFAVLTPFNTPGGSCPPDSNALAGAAHCVGAFLFEAVNPVTFLPMLILQVVFRIAVVIVLVMLIFNLLLRWVNLIFLAIFSPFFFLLGSLPGRGSITSGWFRGILTNVLVFPAVLAVLYIAILLKFASGLNPPEPVTGVISAADIGGLMTFGALVLATRVPAMLEEALDSALSGSVARSGFGAKHLPLIGGMFK